MSSYYEKMLATGEVKCIDEEIPFEIPQGWEWCRLNEVATSVTDFVASGSFASLRENVKYYSTKEYALLVRTKDLSCNFSNDLVYTDKHGYDFLSNSNLFGGELILPNIGASIGKVFIVPNLNMPMTLAPNSVMIRLDDECTKSWLYNVFSSPFGYDTLWSISSSTAQGKFNKTDFRKVLISIPPIEEQNRIVTKIKELSPYIEKYSKAQEHLDVWNVAIKEILQKSILQEAIQGRLVPQIAEEGTSQELLEQIKTEKQKLVKEGKLKKSALNDSVIFRGDDNKYYELIGKKCLDITEQIPFEISSSWEWCRVRNVSNSYIGLTYKPTDIDKKGTIVLRSCNIRNGKLALDDIVRVSSSISEKLLIEENDIIICARNGSKRLVGKSALIRNLPEPMTFGAFMAICKTPIYEYMFAYLQSDLFFGQLRDVSNTTTINQLTQNKFNDFLIPIPPVKEQERIAFKISQLFQKLR